MCGLWVKGILVLAAVLAPLPGALSPAAQPEEEAGRKGKRPHLVMIISEDEYRTHETLPAFADEFLKRDFRISFVLGDKSDPSNLVGVEALQDADVVLLSLRRRTPPKAQLDVIRKFIASGKPLVALRTSSHGFSLFKGKKLADGRANWPDFDRDVLGGNYTGHHGNRAPKAATRIRTVADAAAHPILTGVPREEFAVASWLYKVSPLSSKAVPLLVGRAPGQAKAEPVAWTHTSPAGGRVFYTSLGHPDDFRIPAFRRLLLNGVCWASGLPVPDRLPARK
jgi:type 1 glutamine amidotransferase